MNTCIGTHGLLRPLSSDLPLNAFERSTYDHWCCLFLQSQNADEQEMFMFEDADCQPVKIYSEPCC